ncbi:MAG: sigma 54-interacting transcriptional regulator [Planctomycetes bacterium]|nr:sigma 54-interacting transcriptional regulator [Planctomycetota bacterium]
MNDETIDIDALLERERARAPATRPALVILWSREEDDRAGECAPLPRPGERAVLGRGEGPGRLAFVRQRPGGSEPRPPLAAPSLSREQLVVDGARVARAGKGALRVNGREVEAADLRPGDLVEVSDRLLLLCVERPAVWAGEGGAHAWGAPDAHGLVGESPAAWALRERVAFVARRAEHVLVRGPSGTGKELVARALHRGSPRGRRALVARNAATIPPTLVDAELFGNVKDYPNPGMIDRPGLIGEASGSTLFLDEFAELPPELQAHLLRVLDGGEYHRLGEARARTADLRLVAATNRPEAALKHDVLARLKLRVEVPGLDARPEDVPLLGRHLLAGIAASDAALAPRLFPDGDPSRPPRWTPALVGALARRAWTTHVRELEALLWEALQRGRDGPLDAWDELLAPAPPAAGGVDPESLTREQVQACLDRHGGRQEPAWRELGLSSRFVLARLVKRWGLEVRGRGRGD